MMRSLVKLTGIGKAYGPVSACSDVSLDLGASEVLALVGENGAGKSTLVHILSGVVQPDAGSIAIEGRLVPTLTPSRAQALGIATVYQSFQLIPDLTAIENIVLGAEPGLWGIFIDWPKARREVDDLLRQFPMGDLPLNIPVERLEAGYRQYTEVLRALYRKPEIIILDEPTALMPPNLVAPFLELIRALKAAGKSVVLVTHRLDEVAAVADRVAMLRRGEVLGVLEHPFTARELIARLGWTERFDSGAKTQQAAKDTATNDFLVRAEGLTLTNTEGVSLNQLSFTVARREFVGMLGATGNGQRELVDLLVGLRPPDAGKLSFQSVVGTVEEPISSLALAYIPADTSGRGLAIQLDITRNLMLGYHRTSQWRSWGRLRWPRIEAWCQALAKRYSIRMQSCRDPLTCLSGGTRQKVLLAREIGRGPVLMVAEYPFKGLDLITRNTAADDLVGFAAAGGAVLLIDSDPEILSILCDRIYILWRGRIAGVYDQPFPPTQDLLSLMVGTGTI